MSGKHVREIGELTISQELGRKDLVGGGVFVASLAFGLFSILRTDLYRLF